MHNGFYKKHLAAIKKVFLEKHNLPKEYDEWVKHYEFDEENRLEMKEIEECLGDMFSIEVVADMQMNKTLALTRKD